MTGTQRVLEYMTRTKKPVTVRELAQHCATYDGRKIISDLKAAGHPIKSGWTEGENRFGNKVHFKEYWLDEQQA